MTKKMMLLAVLAVMLVAAPTLAGERTSFLPHRELNVGILLPGYLQLDLSGMEFDSYQSRSSRGVNIIGWEATLLRWGRFEFAGLGVGWGVRGSGTKVTVSGEVRHPPEHVFYASSPIRFRIKGETVADRFKWHLTAHPLVTYIRGAGGDRAVFGVAAGVSVSIRSWPH